MKYIALLRGINVGGNNIVKMADLKTAFEEIGMQNVSTYINSGNVLFEDKEQNQEQLVKSIEEKLFQTFGLDLKIVVLSEKEYTSVIMNIPSEWEKDTNIRCYIAYIREGIETKGIAKEMTPKKDIDSIKIGDRAIYMTTKLDGITKSGFAKLTGKKIFKEITIRNYTTAKKLLELISLN